MKNLYHPLCLVLALAAPGALAEDAPEDATEAVVLRPAAPPSALERARMERWRRAWREESEGLERAFDTAHRAAGAPESGRRAHCAPLAEAMLAIDRERILPVPDPAADLHLRRGLRAATLAAVDCLEGRPYAARGKLRRAAAALSWVERRLRRYRPRPPRPEARPDSRPDASS